MNAPNFSTENFPPPRSRRLTPAEYLMAEETAEERHEYYDGAVVAMAGGTRRHAALCRNILRFLGNRLGGKPCEPYGSDLKIRIPGSSYVYPDALVACPPMNFEDARETVLLNPKVVFEVLSESTALHDQTRKLALYSTVPGLVLCVLVSQTRPHVLTYTFRSGDDQSLFASDFHEGLDAILPLPCLGAELPLREIYHGLEFAADTP